MKKLVVLCFCSLFFLSFSNSENSFSNLTKANKGEAKVCIKHRVKLAFGLGYFVEINVAESAVPAHVAHGDDLCVIIEE